MRNARSRRTRGWAAVTTSLVTLLALVVAPMCAPLCAAQACPQAPAATTKGPCHFAEVTKGNGLRSQAVPNCAALESQVADLTSADSRGFLQAQRLRISAGLFDLLLPELHPLARNHGSAACAHRPPPEHASSPAATVVLRI